MTMTIPIMTVDERGLASRVIEMVAETTGMRREILTFEASSCESRWFHRA